MSKSKIEWTDRTWNPVRGCSLVSEGCRNCYAMKQAHRFSGAGQPYEGLTELGPSGPRWTGKIRLVPELLEEPLKWRKPQRVFVNSMSDLFHEDVPDEFIERVFCSMSNYQWHTFQVLTKRPERMMRFLQRDLRRRIAHAICTGECASEKWARNIDISDYEEEFVERIEWPLPNVWLGVSVEDQQTADKRIPLLLQTPAAVRFVSYEPALEPVSFNRFLSQFPYHFTDCPCLRCADNRLELRVDDGRTRWLDWIIVGGESGQNARPFNIQWARDVIAQCKAAQVPVFVKQLGALAINPEAPGMLRDSHGGDMAEWPGDLRVREFPR